MTSIDVVVDDRQTDRQCDVLALRLLLAESLEDCGVQPPAEVGLALVGIDEITALNERHMSHKAATGPTDVLAFPIDGLRSPHDGQPTMVGDIVICPEVAARSTQPLHDEMALLTVHGALHLLGHDHYVPEEAAIMQIAERALLDKYHRAGDPAGPTT